MTNNQSVRLQKYLARCGVASRRASEKLIQEGKISVNGQVKTKLGTKIDESNDTVEYDGHVVKPSSNQITIMLNKPAGYVSTMHDPQGRPCLSSLIPVNEYPNIFPVGRLDRLTCGMLIFTTEGQLGQDLLHPKNEVDKTYVAVIDGYLDEKSEKYKYFGNGIKIKSGITHPAEVKILEHFDINKYLEYENEFFSNCALPNDALSLPTEKELKDKTFTRLSIKIHEGKNRQVRRMFEALGFNVLLLTRKSIGNLKLASLECGKWRKLNTSEIDSMFV